MTDPLADLAAAIAGTPFSSRWRIAQSPDETQAVMVEIIREGKYTGDMFLGRSAREAADKAIAFVRKSGIIHGTISVDEEAFQ